MEENALVGKYTLVSMEMTGEDQMEATLQMAGISCDDVYIEILCNGKCVMTIPNPEGGTLKFEGEYKLDGNKIFLDGESVGTIDGDMIIAAEEEFTPKTVYRKQ